MWVFLNNAFLSIVEDYTDTDNLLVRGRLKGDIERIFPKAKVYQTPERDYRFRTHLPKEEVSARIAAAVLEINYSNFKSSVSEHVRHDTYFRVWFEMYNAQKNQLNAEKLSVATI